MLDQNDVAFFRANGYLLPRDQVFPPAKLDALEAIFDEHLTDKGDKLSDELDTPHFRDPRLLDFLLSDEVLDTVEPLVGPDIALWTSHFISKEPHVGRATPWHEDSAYWNGRFDRYDQIVTVWLALGGPSNRENGLHAGDPGLSSGRRLPRQLGADRHDGTDLPRRDSRRRREPGGGLRARTGRVLAARWPDRARREAEHQRAPADRLHDALLPGVGEDHAGGAEQGMEDLAGAR